MASKDDGRGTPRDMVLIGPRAEDGAHHCLRQRDGVLEAGFMAPTKEGEPLRQGVELVQIRAIGSPGLYEVNSFYKPGEEDAGHGGHGPVKVNSMAFQQGWDAIWGDRSSLN